MGVLFHQKFARFTSEREEPFLVSFFKPILPDAKDYDDRRGAHTVFENKDCAIYYDMHREKAIQRDHMASYPSQYNPPVGKYHKQVVDLSYEAAKQYYKWQWCRWDKYLSTSKGSIGAREGGFVNVDTDHIVAEYESYGAEIEEWRKNGELEKAKAYMGVWQVGDTPYKAHEWTASGSYAM